MIALIFLFYFLIGIQIIFKPNSLIKLQFLFCLFLTMLSFNFHSHLLAYLSVL
ncbi:DUF5993 family protein [Legionella oakridgensis]|uniref:DUF5993 family protein n=1 Tax=Legionella oakridgensis TaxID=29423 RepID=UPI0004B9FF01